MKNTSKYIIGIFVVAILVIAGIKLFGQQTVGASVNGTTNSTQRIASLSCNTNITSTTTIASFLNSDSNDRMIQSVNVWLIPTSTSPIANIEVGTSTGPAGQTSGVIAQTSIATATLPVYVDTNAISGTASTSQPFFASNGARSWVAGSYLNVTLNATSGVATNIPSTENSCLVVVKYAAE